MLNDKARKKITGLEKKQLTKAYIFLNEHFTVC
jgi:hypothetical protein